MKRTIFLLAGLFISVVSLYLAFRDFDLGAVWDAMLRVRWPFFLLMLVPYVFTFLAKVWRWHVLFHPDEKRAPFRLLFPALMISYIPLPFRMGEVARGVVASARSGVPAARVFSTILVEKVLDVLTLLLLLGVALPFVELSTALNRGALIALGVVVLMLVVAMLVLVLWPDLARRVVAFFARWLPEGLRPRVLEAADHALQGLAPLSDPAIAVRVGLWSLATWVVNMVTVYLMLLAFNVEVTPLAAAVLVVVTNLSMAVPSAPGYVGPFELAVVAVLDALGQPRDASQAFAIIYHFIGLVPVALIGVVAAVQQGIKFSALRAEGDDSADASTGEPAAVPVSRQDER